jgi:hypothetical protein
MPGDEVLIVISHYDARPAEPLCALVEQLESVPAGWPFRLRIVVNQAGPAPRDLPSSLARHELLRRPNEGFNIGAWEHGWRHDPPAPAYLFLQDDCRVRRRDWLLPFVHAAAGPGVGLVGERINPAWDAPWSEIAERYHGHRLPEHEIAGRPADRLACYFDFFARHRIPLGARGTHLQSLVLFAGRAVLEAIDGFRTGRNYGEAIAAEIAISKLVQARGWSIREVGPEPLWCFGHPQWSGRELARR